MEGCAEIEDQQDGICMIKFLHRVYFNTNGFKQSMIEMVLANKKIYLYFQKEEWSLDNNTPEPARKNV